MPRLVQRARGALVPGVRRWRAGLLPIVQAALAAGIAWLVGIHFDHWVPFFAPVAAVVCLGITLDQRLRRGIELVAGVIVGIAIGDLLSTHIGTGPWQIGLLVVVALSAAVLLDGGPVLTVQSAVSAVLVATVYIPGQNSGSVRAVDALIGGAVAVAVAALLPANPVSLAHRHAAAALAELAGLLRGMAQAVREDDAELASAVLHRARESNRTMGKFRSALLGAEEIAAIAPIHWRRRPVLARYIAVVAPIEEAFGNTRVLVRRAVAALRDREPVPPALTTAVDQLADAVDLLAVGLASDTEPSVARLRLRTLASSAGAGMLGDGAFSALVMLAQLRSIVVDLLQATGVARADALALLPVTHR